MLEPLHTAVIISYTKRHVVDDEPGGIGSGWFRLFVIRNISNI